MKKRNLSKVLLSSSLAVGFSVCFSLIPAVSLATDGLGNDPRVKQMLEKVHNLQQQSASVPASACPDTGNTSCKTSHNNNNNNNNAIKVIREVNHHNSHNREPLSFKDTYTSKSRPNYSQQHATHFQGVSHTSVPTTKKKKITLHTTSFIRAITVLPDRVVIRYKDTINFRSFRNDPKTIVFDFLNSTYKVILREVKPRGGDIIKDVAYAYHPSKKRYGVPYLRVAIHLKKSSVKYFIQNDGSRLFVIRLRNKRLNSSHKRQPVAVTQKKHHHIAKKHKSKKKVVKKSLPVHTKIKKVSTVSVKPPPKRYETARDVNISLKNISCIQSPYPIKKVIVSKEDKLQIDIMGQEIFIKILPKETIMPSGDKMYSYSRKTRDIYVVTTRKTYSLHLIPVESPAITYKLETVEEPKPPKNVLKVSPPSPTKNQIATLKGYPPQIDLANPKVNAYKQQKRYSEDIQSQYTKYILDIIKTAYQGNIPEGFSLLPFKDAKEYEQLSLKGKYRMVGDDVVLYAYEIIAHKRVQLDNAQFVWLIPKPIASVVLNPSLQPGDTTTVYLVGGK